MLLFFFIEYQSQPERSQNDGQLQLYIGYKINDLSSVFTTSRLNRIKELEEIIRKFPDMEKFCLASPLDITKCSLDVNEPWKVSVVDEFFTEAGASKSISTTLNSIATNLDKGKATFVGVDFDKTNPTAGSARTRSTYRFGLPLKGYKTSKSDVAEQHLDVQDYHVKIRDELKKEPEFQCESCDMQVYLYSVALLGEAAGSKANEDMAFITLSIVFVMVYIGIHTKSLFLSLAGIGQIMFSFPIAFVIYRFVLGVDLFLSIEFLSVFIILAIGADDCFVFVDAWTQSSNLAKDGSLQTRMAYTWKRASKAMLVTSFTTFAAFMATGISDIKPISAFGQYSAVLVIVNFMLVCTYFPCCVATWHKRFRFKSFLTCCMGKWGKNVGLDGKMLNGAKKEGVEAPSIELPVVMKSNQPPVTNKNDESNIVAVNKPVAVVKSPAKGSADHQDNRLRTIEKFFNGFWTEFVYKWRWAIIATFILLGAGGAYFTAKMTPIKEQENWLPDSMEIMKAKNFFDDEFMKSQDDPTLYVKFVFGIKGLDTSGIDKWDPEDYGVIEWDSDFDLSPTANQQFIVDYCTALRNADKFIIQADVTCFMDAYREWRLAKSANFPATFTGTAAEQKTKFNADFKAFSDAQPFWSSTNVINFDDKNNPLYVMVYGNTGLEFTEVYDVKKPIYDAAEDFMIAKKATAPNGLDNTFLYGDGGWAWMFTSRSFVTNLIQGILISMTVATIVLMLSTQNWIVSLVTMVNIIGILFCVIGSMKIRGWDLGVTESIAGVVVVGFSFDYAVHLANSFVESHETTAKERMRSAMREMGISVVAGAITTAGAGSVMFLCFMMFFTKFAFMMVMNVSAALVWSCVFLPAVLMAVGPDKNGGQIFKICWSKKTDEEKGSSHKVDI
eukprot:TRINITY_DN4883_c0_g2_i1.p1 TRINITY_DN4883_c0_g2~~TRINITY_DN4883_c0_g2_i1.p1  ORF type:complete len:896 (-),score=296.27 TRINITY_DN4883_c0_g2_i1:443-3130(-)